MFTVEDAKRVQRDFKLGDKHVVYLEWSRGFVMAHTDAERANQLMLSLEECAVHHWMAGWEMLWGRCRKPYPGSACFFTDSGWYTIEGEGALRVVKGLAL